MNRKLTAVLLSALVTAAGTTAILNAGGEQELARFNEQLKACFPAYQTLEDSAHLPDHGQGRERARNTLPGNSQRR